MMAKIPVTSYAAEWNAVANAGRVFIRIGANPPVPVPLNSAAEFIAVMLMLDKSGVVFETQTKELEIPPRIPGA
jgi:hypothetical protein